MINNNIFENEDFWKLHRFGNARSRSGRVEIKPFRIRSAFCQVKTETFRYADPVFDPFLCGRYIGESAFSNENALKCMDKWKGYKNAFVDRNILLRFQTNEEEGFSTCIVVHGS